MGASRTDNSNHTADLLALAAQGDETALRELYDQYREWLKRMIRLRMSRRLKTRLDDSDILQEAYLEVAKKLPKYTQNPEAPFWRSCESWSSSSSFSLAWF